MSNCDCNMDDGFGCEFNDELNVGLGNEFNDGFGNEFNDEFGNEFNEGFGNEFNDGFGNEFNDGLGDEFNDEFGNEFNDGFGNEFNDGLGDGLNNNFYDEFSNEIVIEEKQESLIKSYVKDVIYFTDKYDFQISFNLVNDETFNDEYYDEYYEFEIIIDTKNLNIPEKVLKIWNVDTQIILKLSVCSNKIYCILLNYDGKQSLAIEQMNEILKKYITNTFISLKNIYEYILLRFSNLQKFCSLCDEPHLFDLNNVMPCICNRIFCVWRWQILGLDKNSHIIGMDYKVIKLLWNMLKCTIMSNRINDILIPYPIICDTETQNIIISEEKKDDKLLRDIISKINIDEIKEISALHEYFNKSHNLALPLLNWMISTNKTFIHPLDNDKYIELMCCEEQFIMLYNSPEKMIKFNNKKNKYGSVFAFHGSGTDNWHSIIRHGLFNASGTKYQLNGALYGSGVYVSHTANYSLQYSQNSQNNLNQKFSYFCICEIINNPKKITKHGNIWVIKDSKLVETRFLLKYKKTVSLSPDVDSTNNTFIDQVTKAMM